MTSYIPIKERGADVFKVRFDRRNNLKPTSIQKHCTSLCINFYIYHTVFIYGTVLDVNHRPLQFTQPQR